MSFLKFKKKNQTIIKLLFYVIVRKKIEFDNYFSATREFFFLKLITVAMNFSKSRNFCAIFFNFHSNNTSVLHNKAFWGM